MIEGENEIKLKTKNERLAYGDAEWDKARVQSEQIEVKNGESKRELKKKMRRKEGGNTERDADADADK